MILQISFQTIIENLNLLLNIIILSIFTFCERMSYLVFKTSLSCRLFVSSNNIDGKQLMYL